MQLSELQASGHEQDRVPLSPTPIRVESQQHGMQSKTAAGAVGIFNDAYQVEIADSRSCWRAVQACTNSVQAGTTTQRIPLQAAQAAVGYT